MNLSEINRALPEYIPSSQEGPDRPLTRREQFAMAAMQGLLANPVVQESSVKIPELAGEAVMYADALIAALEKEETR